jgi:uncharacterized protein (UPF0335 family)
MTAVGGIAGEKLRSLVERIERLDEEIKALNDDKRDVYAQAKGGGFDVKVLRLLLQRRRLNNADRAELDSLLDIYERALGMDHGGAARAMGLMDHGGAVRAMGLAVAGSDARETDTGTAEADTGTENATRARARSEKLRPSKKAMLEAAKALFTRESKEGDRVSIWLVETGAGYSVTLEPAPGEPAPGGETLVPVTRDVALGDLPEGAGSSIDPATGDLAAGGPCRIYYRSAALFAAKAARAERSETRSGPASALASAFSPDDASAPPADAGLPQAQDTAAEAGAAASTRNSTEAPVAGGVSSSSRSADDDPGIPGFLRRPLPETAPAGNA